jgi:protein SCO1/2
MKARLMTSLLLIGSIAAVLTISLAGDSHLGHKHGADRDPHGLEALAQTLLPVERGAPVAVPPLVTADGVVFTPARLTGRWSLVFFGFTSCPDVCPTTLQVLSEFARDPASGIPGFSSGAPAGATQVVFVTVDPKRDTPARLKSYLAHFDERFIGLTGSRADLDRFAGQLGAGSEPSGRGAIDHSASVFALDPQGRLAGVLLRPADPLRIVADLNTLRAPRGATHVSHIH